MNAFKGEVIPYLVCELFQKLNLKITILHKVFYCKQHCYLLFKNQKTKQISFALQLLHKCKQKISVLLDEQTICPENIVRLDYKICDSAWEKVAKILRKNKIKLRL